MEERGSLGQWHKHCIDTPSLPKWGSTALTRLPPLLPELSYIWWSSCAFWVTRKTYHRIQLSPGRKQTPNPLTLYLSPRCSAKDTNQEQPQENGLFIQLPLCCQRFVAPLEQVKKHSVFSSCWHHTMLCSCSRWPQSCVTHSPGSCSLLSPEGVVLWEWCATPDVPSALCSDCSGQLSFGLFSSFYSLCATREQQFCQEPESRFWC